MEPPRQKRLARLGLLIVFVLGLAWLLQLDREEKISTDVLDLIPVGERAPELTLVRSLASEEQARVALFALTVSSVEKRDEAANAFAAVLASSPAFAEVVPMGDSGARDRFGRYLHEHRFELLLPTWLEAKSREHAAANSAAPWSEWLAETAAANLEGFLTRPEAMPFQDLLPHDPLLLLPGFVEQVQPFLDSGSAAGQDERVALIWARVSASPLREEGQAPVFAAVERALAAAQAIAPEADLRWTGISRFAAESRERIQKEMGALNLLSFVAVLGVAALCVRRLPKVLHLAPVILGALLGAWVMTTLAWERVHVLVFVIGSLLGGVAVDYGFYLYLQPRRRADEPYREKVGRLLKPLLASALTAITGFSLLLLSELPLIRQLGVFVSAGLLSALAVALLWFAQVDEAFLETRGFVRARAHRPGPRLRSAARLLLGLGVLVAAIGPWRLNWRDDIRQLEIPAPELRANDRAVRTLFGETAGRTLYLTPGETPAAARTALERFLAWHAEAYPDRAVGTLGRALPTRENWEELPVQLERLRAFPSALRVALERHGFEAESFGPFLEAWDRFVQRPPRENYADLAQNFASELQGPMALLLSIQPGNSWFATIADHPPGAEPPPELATVSANQLESLNRLFGRYRDSALRLSSIGLGLVGLSVFAIYGWRHGLAIFAVPAGSCLFAFGALGLAGATLNLFHLLGAFLGVCLSHNYAIFTAENALRHEEPPPSIRLSALTTSASFGVLALSQIPVVAALGVTVALIVITALAIVELIPLARPAAC